ncbi:MAG: hypothetical protein KGQ66_05040 [Acidobacteriota bacterium]|nr:hypothetical protein [Acidobacteriota bacterium]
MTSSDTGTSSDTADSQVLLYWRPGCPYCSGLKRRLRQLGVRATEVNIWADPDAAAEVRAVADGNETVPTVVIGDTAMVNPTGSQVLAAARRLAPSTVDPSAPDQPGRDWPAAPVLAAWVVVIASAAASFALDAYGHSNISWGLDVVAVAAYLAVRRLRRSATGDPSLRSPESR